MTKLGKSVIDLYPTPDVVHREFKLIDVAFRSGHEYPHMVVLGVEEGVPYRALVPNLYTKSVDLSPVAVLQLVRDRLPSFKTPRHQPRVVLVAFEDQRHRPDRSFNIVIDGIPGYDMERRWCSATILPPMYTINRGGTPIPPPPPRLGTWTELYNPAPVLFEETRHSP